MHLSNATTRRRTLVNKPPRTVVFPLTKCVTNRFGTDSLPGRLRMSDRVKARDGSTAGFASGSAMSCALTLIFLGVPHSQEPARTTDGKGPLLIDPKRSAARRKSPLTSYRTSLPNTIQGEGARVRKSGAACGKQIADVSLGVLARGRSPGVAGGGCRNAASRFQAGRQAVGDRSQAKVPGRQRPSNWPQENDLGPRKGSSQSVKNLILNPSQFPWPLSAVSA